jgi:large subunit ribosomal protein L10
MANKEASVAELTEKFQSSTAVLLTEYRGLTVAQLKTLRKSISEDATFAVVKNTLTKIVVKGGYFDGNPLSAAEVGKLADLESREVLLGKLAGAFKASLFGAAYLFNAPLSKAVRTVDALREKQESAS